MRPSDPEHDPVVRELRGRITDADRAILTAVNARIELVRELREHKLAQGWDFVDQGREERLLAVLAGENPGPLSETGLRELFAELLTLTKREVADGPTP
ncbi:MAG: chorismate mutase [Gaiellaceae bacterium]